MLSITAGGGPLYKIIPVKGEPWFCNEDHILTLVKSRSRHSQPRYAGQIIDLPIRDYLNQTSFDKFHRRNSYSDVKLFRVPVDFPEVAVDVDPYLVGVWLGDGTRGEAIITTTDDAILDECLVRARHYGTRLQMASTQNALGSALRLSFITKASDGQPRNRLRKFFRTECVTVDKQKTIPSQYLRNCESLRLHLLTGLLDTDGDLASNCFSITTKYPQLQDDILYLCRSLGFAAYSTPTTKGIKSTGFTGVYPPHFY